MELLTKSSKTVANILKLTDRHLWNLCPGKRNPAGSISRMGQPWRSWPTPECQNGSTDVTESNQMQEALLKNRKSTTLVNQSPAKTNNTTTVTPLFIPVENAKMKNCLEEPEFWLFMMWETRKGYYWKAKNTLRRSGWCKWAWKTLPKRSSA